jgi:hypothetical protein
MIVVVAVGEEDDKKNDTKIAAMEAGEGARARVIVTARLRAVNPSQHHGTDSVGTGPGRELTDGASPRCEPVGAHSPLRHAHRHHAHPSP